MSTEHTHREPWYLRGTYTHSHPSPRNHIHPELPVMEAASTVLDMTVWLELATGSREEAFFVSGTERVYRIRDRNDNVIGWIKRVRESTDTSVGGRHTRIRRPGKGRWAWTWRAKGQNAFARASRDTRKEAIESMLREMSR